MACITAWSMRRDCGMACITAWSMRRDYVVGKDTLPITREILHDKNRGVVSKDTLRITR